MSVPQVDLLTVATPPGVRAAFSTRRGGVSAGSWSGANLSMATGDDWAAVRSNRAGLCRAFGCDPNHVTMLRQVHGAAVRSVPHCRDSGGLLEADTLWPEADALVSGAADAALLVLSADCVPVLFWRMDGSAVGAAHAGWRGLVAGVIEQAIRQLGGQGPVGAAIGPAISQPHYEVDEGLAQRFSDHFGPQVVSGRRVDLAACAARCLEREGVSPAQIAAEGRCSFSSPDDFFSHRRDGAASGRQGAIIMRTRDARSERSGTLRE